MLRPTVIYGPGDDKFLPKLVENLQTPGARIVGDGKNTVDLVHVDDVVRFLLRVLTDDATIGKTYNVNHPDNPTWRELVDLVSREVGCESPKKQLPYAAGLAVAGLMSSFRA